MPEVIGLSLEQSDAAADTLAAAVERGVRDVASEVAARLEAEEAAAVTVEDLNIIQSLWLAYVTGTLLPLLAELLAEANSEQLSAFTAALQIDIDAPTRIPGVDRLADLPVFSEPVATEQYLSSARNRLVNIGDELWNHARTSLAEGLAAGEAMPKLAVRVRDAAGVTEPRARVIARTEAHGARQTVAMATTRRIAAESGAPSAIRKRWQATEDERTRLTHDAADGQIVELNEPFQVGGASLAFPGDPAGPPQETISCRCVALSVIDVVALRTAFALDEELITAAGQLEFDVPWSIHRNHPECATGEWAVVKDADDELEGCHETRESAIAQIAALNAAEDGEREAAATDVLTASVRRSGWSDLPVASADRSWSGPGAAGRIAASCGVDAEGAGTSAWACYARNFLFRDDDANPQTRGAYKLGVVDIIDGERTLIPRGVFAVAAVLQGARGGADIPQAQQESLRSVVAGLYQRINDALDTDHEVPWADSTQASAFTETMRNTVPWSGVLLVEGSPTGDGRQFASNSLTWPELGSTDSLEIPLGWKYERAHGGVDTDKVVTVGRIDHIERSGNVIHGRGVINLDSEWGREAARQMGTRDAPGFLAGVSIDADDPERAEIEYQFPSECALDDNGYPALEDGEIAAQCMRPEVEIYHSGRIRAATLVDIPAFVEARLYLDETLPETLTTSAVDTAVTASAYTITIPDLPPANWFDEPAEAPQIGAITVTDDGRIFGYLAPKHVAHRGMRDRRVEVPMKNVDYGIWMNRATIVDDGKGNFTKLATGPITMDCGHAPTAAHIKGAARREHYDNACSVVATVRAGENQHGVWISGALLPGVTADQVTRMMACQLSGDWGPHREQPGKRELAAALLVPVPGFPRRTYQSVSVRGGQLHKSVTPVRFGTWDRHDEPVGLSAAVQRVAAAVGLDARSQLHEFAAELDS